MALSLPRHNVIVLTAGSMVGFIRHGEVEDTLPKTPTTFDLHICLKRSPTRQGRRESSQSS